MSVYKYVTTEGALRYLRTWALRITPADQFNDPFEMRPTFNVCPDELPEPTPSLIAKHMKLHFSQMAEANGLTQVSEQTTAAYDSIVAYFMRLLTPPEEEKFIEFIRQFSPTLTAEELCNLRSEFDELYRKAIEDARAQIPAFSKAAQSAIHQALPKSIGVLCLSGSYKHPLMWAHYTDSHKGALLEFDEGATCFNRQRDQSDDFGRLHRVWYSDSRPKILLTRSSDALVMFALTKALEWAYEQELRLLWPLSKADRTVESKGKLIHLIDVPSAALRSITIGCKADKSFVSDVLRALIDAKPLHRIGVRVASIDDETFSLNYHDIV